MYVCVPSLCVQCVQCVFVSGYACCVCVRLPLVVCCMLFLCQIWVSCVSRVCLVHLYYVCIVCTGGRGSGAASQITTDRNEIFAVNAQPFPCLFIAVSLFI